MGIFLNTTDELIGYAGICDISKVNKSGELYIFIGEKKMWGKGIGTIVTEQLLKIGFLDYNLNRIIQQARVFSEAVTRDCSISPKGYHWSSLKKILPQAGRHRTSFTSVLRHVECESILSHLKSFFLYLP